MAAAVLMKFAYQGMGVVGCNFRIAVVVVAGDTSVAVVGFGEEVEWRYCSVGHR